MSNTTNTYGATVYISDAVPLEQSVNKVIKANVIILYPDYFEDAGNHFLRGHIELESLNETIMSVVNKVEEFLCNTSREQYTSQKNNSSIKKKISFITIQMNHTTSHY